MVVLSAGILASVDGLDHSSVMPTALIVYPCNETIVIDIAIPCVFSEFVKQLSIWAGGLDLITHVSLNGQSEVCLPFVFTVLKV